MALTEQEIKKGVIMVFPTKFAFVVPYKDSERIHPPCCNQECWIGPEQKKLRDKHGCDVVCAECLTQLLGPEAVMRQMTVLTNKRAGE